LCLSLVQEGEKLKIFRIHFFRSNKGKTPLDFAPEDSEIRELLLTPPKRIIIIPEKAHSEMNGSLNESGTNDKHKLEITRTKLPLDNYASLVFPPT
jgi:hypothetical protein